MVVVGEMAAGETSKNEGTGQKIKKGEGRKR